MTVNSASRLTAGQAWAALKDVHDPELPISLVELGMIYGVQVEGQAVSVRLGLTATACPAIEFITHDITERMHREGFAHVSIELVWDPPWTRDRITEEGKSQLRTWGISV